MQKIVYLIGAGASAGANTFDSIQNKTQIKIPLAHNFEKAIQSYCNSNNQIFNGSYNNELNTILEELKQFAAFIENYNTIDEAMRMLYLNKELETFNRYKQLTSIVFYILECMHKHKDTRYEQFLLTLVDNNFKLPDNVYILSWNYDFQFELATSYINNGELNSKTLLKNQNYYKINGSAYDFDFRKSWHQDTKLKSDNPSGIITNHAIHIEYLQQLNKNDSSIKFAWEDKYDERTKNDEKLAEFINRIDGSKNTVSIVVIGYSFPYVNSIYDGTIFNLLKPNTIYIQDPHLEDSAIQDIRNRFKNKHAPNEFIQIKQANRFYLPTNLYK